MRVMSVSFDLRLAVCEPSEERLEAGGSASFAPAMEETSRS